MKNARCFFAWLCIAIVASPAGATQHVYFWDGKALYVGSDSLRTYGIVGQGGETRSVCKQHIGHGVIAVAFGRVGGFAASLRHNRIVPAPRRRFTDFLDDVVKKPDGVDRMFQDALTEAQRDLKSDVSSAKLVQNHPPEADFRLGATFLWFEAGLPMQRSFDISVKDWKKIVLDVRTSSAEAVKAKWIYFSPALRPPIDQSKNARLWEMAPGKDLAELVLNIAVKVSPDRVGGPFSIVRTDGVSFQRLTKDDECALNPASK